MVQVKQKRLIIVMILTLLLFFAETAAAQPAPTVALTAQVQQAEQIVSGEVTISTTEPALFHDQVKLSWHVYDEAGNLLVFENQRLLFTLGEDNKASVPVEIDLSKLGLTPQTIIIQFDLVDEENLFWFADSPAVILQREGVSCEIQAPQVTLRCSEGAQIVSRQLNTQVQIDFGQTNLYNEGLKLSWHTKDKNGQEIAFENERIPVPAPVDGVSTIDLSLDFRDNDRLSGERNFTLQFDLVDEVNGYWYAQNPAVDFQTQELVYQYHFLTELANTFVNMAKENPLILLLNFIVDAAAIAGLIFYIRRRKGKNQGVDIVKGQAVLGALGRGVQTDIVPYAIVAILSACAFISIYGIYILNPTYTDWLMAGGDLSQHYLGWTGYRNSDWMFPIGMHNSLSYPECTSIIFTDSIPLFAVFFKLLSPILPEQFQYFGLWGLMCFVLQGVFAARILKTYIKNYVAVILASQLFIYAPIMLMRMYVHTALAGQWVILFSMIMLLDYHSYANNIKKSLAHVCIMGILASATHIYFILINGIVLLGICIRELIERKKIKRCAVMLGVYLAIVVFFVWILGGFTSDANVVAGGLGGYSFNLNGLFNPQGWSYYLQDLPQYSSWQLEGLAYLGLGCILLLVLSLILFFNSAEWKKALKRNGPLLFSLILVCVIASIVALSPIITLNENVLLSYKIPEFINKIWSMFRASGRVIWVVVYITTLCSCILIFKYLNKRVIIVVLILAVFIQISDLQVKLKEANVIYNREIVYETPLKNTMFWDKIAENEKIKHIVLTDVNQSYDTYFAFADWAAQNNKTSSCFYFARANPDLLKKNATDALSNISYENLYVFFEPTKLECVYYDLYYYDVDGMIIGYKDRIDGFQEIDPSKLVAKITYSDNQYLTPEGGIDTENGRILYPNGLSYGPYWSLLENAYMLSVIGSGFTESTIISITSDMGQNRHDYEIISHTDSEIDILFSLSESTQNVEFTVQNSGADNICLQEIQVQLAPTT